MLAGGHAPNALPQTATATVNCRIFPGVAPAAVQAELQRLAGEAIEIAPLGDVHFSDASPLRVIRSAPPDKPTLSIGNPHPVAYDGKREQILVPN